MDVDVIVSNKSKFKGVVIDTNLFLLLLLGSFDQNQIGSHRKLKKFDITDFEKLISFLRYFEGKIFITTNILTEVCNHCNNYNESVNYSFFKFIHELLSTYTDCSQKVLQIVAPNQQAFFKFGITDATLVHLAKDNILVITDDFPLYHYLSTQNFPTINYTHFQLL